MIILFGSINLDLVATVERLPNAGETLTARSFATCPGGKGANQALAARRAGSSVAMVGAVGSDTFAVPALALLRGDGVDISGVRAVDTSTGVALIHVDAQGENAITVVAGANGCASADWVPDTALDASTIIVMQLEVPLSQVDALAAARDRKIPWMRALKEAVAAGSLACTQAGAQPSLPRQHAIAEIADTI